MTLNSSNPKKTTWIGNVFGHFSFRGAIALIVVTASFGFLFCVLFVPIPEQNKETINVTIGFVLVTLGIVIGYYFGTSKDQSDNSRTSNVNSLMRASGTSLPLDDEPEAITSK